MRQQLEELGIKVSHQSGREIICFCPLHEDKHPSFSYNTNTHLFHCFNGCINGRGLPQLMAKLGLKVAPVTVLADTTTSGKPLPLIPILPLALDNFGEVFLVARKFNKNTIRDWKLMYWEEEDAVVIPYPDIGFIMRFLKAVETKNKYKYVHGTKIADSLFGIHMFKSDPIAGKVVLVEGALDVIWCHQNGITSALGLMHSDITPEQRYQLIKCGGLNGMVYLMLDNDQGGEKAARKVAGKLYSEGFRVYKCILPEGSDPNDVDSATLHRVVRDASRWTPA